MNYEELEEKTVLIIEETKVSIKITLKLGLANGTNMQLLLLACQLLTEGCINTIRALDVNNERIIVLTTDAKSDLERFYRTLLITYAKTFKNLSKRNPVAQAIYNGISAKPTEQDIQVMDEMREKSITIGSNNEDIFKMVNPSEALRFKLTSGESAESQMQISSYGKKVESAMKIFDNSGTDKYSQEILLELQRLYKYKLNSGTQRKISLRSKAEMTVRRMQQDEDLEILKNKGVRYVLCSQHQDASKRCSVWQGLLYLVDVPVGMTFEVLTEKENPKDYSFSDVPKTKHYTIVDGMKCYLLSDAMRNGLFSYNCRHRLIEYQKGMKVPQQYKVNSLKQERKRIIDQQARAKERELRNYKELAILETDPDNKKEIQNKIKELTWKYTEFVDKHNLVYADWRINLLTTEKKMIK